MNGKFWIENFVVGQADNADITVLRRSESFQDLMQVMAEKQSQKCMFICAAFLNPENHAKDQGRNLTKSTP